MQHKTKLIEHLGTLISCLLFLTSAISNVYSEELQNIGLRDMPSALKMRFPVCDKQLLVNWVNPAKYQGDSEYV